MEPSASPPAMPIEPMTTEWNGFQMSFAEGEIPSETDEVSAVLVIAVKDEQFLLADIPNRGWCIPSGHVEPGETAEQAARRETFEEVGAIVGECFPLGTYHMMRDGEDKLAPVYAAEVLQESPLPPSESLGTRYATFEELGQIYHIWSPIIERAFQLALERLQK